MYKESRWAYFRSSGGSWTSILIDVETSPTGFHALMTYTPGIASHSGTPLMSPDSGSMLMPRGSPTLMLRQNISNVTPCVNSTPALPTLAALAVRAQAAAACPPREIIPIMTSADSSRVAEMPIPRSILCTSSSSSSPDPSSSSSSNMRCACSGSRPAENVIAPHSALRVPSTVHRRFCIGKCAGSRSSSALAL
eukprot:2794507-Rhodomonas_salina.1